MPKSKKTVHHKTSHSKTVQHATSSSSNSLFKSSILGHKLTPPVLIVLGIVLVVLQGIIALVGFAVIIFGVISLLTNLFKGKNK